MEYGKCPFYCRDSYNRRCWHGTGACTYNDYVTYCSKPEKSRECYCYYYDYSK